MVNLSAPMIAVASEVFIMTSLASTTPALFVSTLRHSPYLSQTTQSRYE